MRLHILSDLHWELASFGPIAASRKCPLTIKSPQRSDLTQRASTKPGATHTRLRVRVEPFTPSVLDPVLTPR